MPRFLAVDYFAIAQQDARAALSRLLLSVPAHLEQVETYVHQGIVPSSLYRTPWIKSTPFTIEEDSVEEQLSTLTNHHEGTVERYENDTEYCPEAECEIVPSSNPCSQESIDEEMLNKLEALHPKDNGQEYFDRETKEDDMDDMFLEEMCEDFMLASGPSIEKLLGRLKPMVMEDPFLDEDGKPVQESKILGPSGKFDEADRSSLYEGDINQSELVLKERIESSEEQERFIETNIQEEIDIDTSIPDVKQLLCDAKEEKLDGLLEDDLMSLKNNTPCEMCVESLAKEETAAETLDFLLLNDVSMEFKESEVMLESPMLEKATAADGILTTPWTEEATLSTTEECDIQSDILSQDSKAKVEKELQTYFDDILALKLKEPDCPLLATVHVTPNEVMKELDVKSDLFETKNLDLELQWDPFYRRTPPLKLELPESVAHKSEGKENFEDAIQKQPVPMEKEEDKKIVRSALLPTLYHPQELLSLKYSNLKPPVQAKPPVQTPTHPVVTEKPAQSNPARPLQTPIKVPDMLHSPISVCTPAKFDDISIFMSMRSAKKRQNSRFSKAKIIERPANTDISKDIVKQTSSLSMLRDLNKEKKGEEQKHNGNTSEYVTPENPPNSPVRNTTDLDCTIAPSTPSTPTLSKRSSLRKCNIISVALDPLHEDLLAKLEEQSQRYIQYLASRRLLPSSQDFFSLTPDVTRFILKQHERKRQDMINSIAMGSDSDYAAVIMLHTLVCCTHMVTHSCILSAVMQLESMKEKYGGHGTFTEIEEIIEKVQCNQKTPHPAMLKLCENLSHWLVKKKLKSPGHDPKILIMMKQGTSGLCETIANVVSSIVTTEVFKPGSSQLTPQDICAQLDKHTCLVIPAPLIDPTFPWSQFSMVVHYDYREGQDKWKDICGRQNIRFLGVQIQAPKPQPKPITAPIITPPRVDIHDQPPKSTANTKPSQAVSAMRMVSQVQSPHQAHNHGLSPRIPSANTASMHQVAYTLIASNHVVEQSALLQELESKHKIFVSSRLCNNPLDPDICISGEACIMLLPLSSGTPSNELVNKTVTRLGRLLLGYSMVWIILHGNCTSSRPSSSDYLFSGNAVSIVAKIQAVVANFSKMVEPATAKVLMCDTAAATARMIRQIVDISKPDASDLPDPNQHEILFSRLPCLNAITAHQVLQKIPLANLVLLSVKQLKHYFPHIPQAQLEVLWNVVNVNQGIGLDTPVVPETEVGGGVEPVRSRDPNEGFVNYSPDQQQFSSEPFSPGRRCELPDLKLSQPNEYAKAEMEGRLLNSFIEEDIESPFDLGEDYSILTERNDAPFQQRDRWNEAKYAISRQHQAIQQSRFTPSSSPVLVQRHVEKQHSRPAFTHTPSAYDVGQSSRHPISWSAGSEQRQRSMRTMLSPETNDRAPCIAPVTPTVRRQQPLLQAESPPMDLSIDDVDSEQRKATIARKLAEMSAMRRQIMEDQALQATTLTNPYQHRAQSYQDEQYARNTQRQERRQEYTRGIQQISNDSNDQWGQGVPYRNKPDSVQKKTFSDARYTEYALYTPEKYSNRSNPVSAEDSDGYGKQSSSRKRKLTYLPVPGLKSGQTKLAFL